MTMLRQRALLLACCLAGLAACYDSPSTILDRYVESLPQGTVPKLDWKTAKDSSFCAVLLDTARLAAPRTTKDLSNDDDRFQCASLPIPFDYEDARAGTGNLTLLRYSPSSSGEHKGTKKRQTVFLNPGGPGGLGSVYVASNYRFFERLTGGKYDLIGWDPRGLATSGPNPATCFADAVESAKLTASTNVQIPFTHGLKELNATGYDRALAQYERLANSVPATAKGCPQYSTREQLALLAYQGSYYNAFDMDFLRRAIDNSSLFHYHGVSYGTVFANYYLSMFPEHVGRVVLDGVVDVAAEATEPFYYGNGPTFFGQTEQMFAEFLKLCEEAGSGRCALAKHGKTAEDLLRKFDEALESLNVAPRRASPSRFNASDSLTDLQILGTDIKSSVQAALAAPANNETSFTSIGRLLDLFVSDQTDELYASYYEQSKSLAALIGQQPSSLNAVATFNNDVLPKNYSVREVVDYVGKVAYGLTPRLVAANTNYVPFYARYGSVVPSRKATWTGGFGFKEALRGKKVLIIGNRIDPVTVSPASHLLLCPLR